MVTIWMQMTEPVPEPLIAGIGAILHSIRSSLDLLATALAKRHGATKTRDVYFPVSRSETEFLSTKRNGGLGKIKKLSAADQTKIKDLKPYEELAAIRQARDEAQAQYAPKLTAEQADKLRRQLAEFDERQRLASIYRPAPLTADEIKIINEYTPEYCLPIKAQMLRATAEDNTERLILLQRQLLSMIQHNQMATEKAALQERAQKIIAEERRRDGGLHPW